MFYSEQNHLKISVQGHGRRSQVRNANLLQTSVRGFQKSWPGRNSPTNVTHLDGIMLKVIDFIMISMMFIQKLAYNHII